MARPARTLAPTGLLSLLTALVVYAGVGACTVPGPAESAAPPESVGATAASPGTGSAPARVRELLAEVRIVPDRPSVPGYDRACGPGDGCVFGTDWSDATDAPSSRNGCDTRNDVLALSLDDVVFSERSPDCKVVGGTLRDPYTDRTMDFATEGSLIHVDHLFPLAAAWDLGAAEWSPAQRATFANDTEVELLAVNGTANLSKGDSTPASWLPPHTAYRCAYVTAYLEVALAYDLAVTEADVRVIDPVVRTSC